MLKRKSKHFLIIFSCILVLAVLIGFGITGASEENIIPTAKITEKNLDYRDMIQMVFSVELDESAPEGTPGIIMWEEGVDTYKFDNAIYTSFDMYKDEDGRNCYFSFPIPTSEIKSKYRVSVVIKTDNGKVISSEPELCSIPMYAEERLSDLAALYSENGALTEKELNQKNLYEKLLVLSGITAESYYKYFASKEIFTFTDAEILPVKGGANGIVVLMLDDAKLPSAQITDEILNKYGLVGDIAMQASAICNINSGALNKSTVTEWQEFLKSGRWKIVSHGFTHSMEYYFNKPSMLAEAQNSQEVLRKAFPGQRVLAFAYPGADNISTVHGYEATYKLLKEYVKDYYIAGRWCRNMEYDPETGLWNVPVGTGELKIGKDNDYYFHIAETGSENAPERLFYHVKRASEGYFYTLFQHGVLEDEAYNGNTYWVTRTYMDNLCKEIKKYVDNGTIWNTNYETAILYLRESENASITATIDGSGTKVTVKLTDDLDNSIYNEKLTVRVKLPENWTKVNISCGQESFVVNTKTVNGINIAEFDMAPDNGSAILTSASN